MHLFNCLKDQLDLFSLETGDLIVVYNCGAGKGSERAGTDLRVTVTEPLGMA